MTHSIDYSKESSILDKDSKAKRVEKTRKSPLKGKTQVRPQVVELRPRSNSKDRLDNRNSGKTVSSSLILQKAASRMSLSLKQPAMRAPFESSVDDLSHQQIEIYGQVFEDIIKEDKVYGGLLVNVKKHYDEFISHLLQTNRELQEQLRQTSKRPKFDNFQHELTEKDLEIRRLQAESQAALQQFEAEKQRAEESVKRLTQEVRSLKARESKYLRLLAVLKEKAYPIEELYNTYVKRKPKVPQISVPQGGGVDFHQEFMANIDEFSESWRQTIFEQKR